MSCHHMPQLDQFCAIGHIMDTALVSSLCISGTHWLICVCHTSEAKYMKTWIPSSCSHGTAAILPHAQYQEALGYVKSAIQLAPANARYRRSLGVVHESAEQWLAAADAFERAIEKQPTDKQVCSRVLARLGMCPVA